MFLFVCFVVSVYYALAVADYTKCELNSRGSPLSFKTLFLTCLIVYTLYISCIIAIVD